MWFGDSLMFDDRLSHSQTRVTVLNVNPTQVIKCFVREDKNKENKSGENLKEFRQAIRRLWLFNKLNH